MIAVDDIVQLMKDAGIARDKVAGLLPEQPLDEQGLDSYDRMSLLTEVEDHFDVELSHQVAARLKTLDDIVNHLNSNGKNPSSPPI